MRGNKNHLGIWILAFMVLGISVLTPRMITFAGEINSNEAGLIAAASGTFSYEGKTYRAGTNYINSLSAYLNSDDVDLTAEQVSEALSTMYASIGEGVAQGYLYEVEEEGSTETATTETATSEDTEGDSEDKETSNDTEESTSSSESTSEVSSSDVWNMMSNQTEAKEKLKQRPDKDDASASVTLDEDDIVITTKDKEVISLSKNEPIISDKIVQIACGVNWFVFGITVLCAIILFVTKCMVFFKPKNRRARPGHSKRRKIRHNTRAVLTVTTAVSILELLLLLTIYIGLFNKDAIMQNMQSSGYFRYAYSEYVAENAKELYSDFKDGALDSDEVNSVMDYEEYLFTIKQNSLKILDGVTDIIIPDSNVVPYIYNLEQSYNQFFSVGGVLTILNVVLGIILMVFMDQRRERGLKHTAAAMVSAGFAMIIFTFIMVVGKPYLHLYIEPDYLYLFLMECIKRTVTVMASVTAFAVVLGMILVGMYRYRRE
jgi:hypothetical protein